MHNLICIVCPRGCNIKVDHNLNVTGNFCKRGDTYGKAEITNPTRIVTSTVRLKSDELPRLPVKTNSPVPKSKIFEVMQEINKIDVKPPVKTKDILIENVLSLGVDIIATRTIEK